MVTQTQNYQNKYELDTSTDNTDLDPSKATWSSLAYGINTITPAQSDTVQSHTFYSDNGYTSSEVTGKNPTWSVTGIRTPGDPVQDYIANLEYETGDKLVTLLKWTKTDGRVLIFKVTITNIVTSGGDANNNETFSFTLNNNGQPTVSSNS